MCTEWRSLVCVCVCVCSRFSFLTVNTVITHAPALCTVLSSLFHSISLYGSMIHTPLYLCTHSLDASVFWRKSAKKEGKNRGMAVFTRRWCSWLLENRGNSLHRSFPLSMILRTSRRIHQLFHGWTVDARRCAIGERWISARENLVANWKRAFHREFDIYSRLMIAHERERVRRGY